MKNNNSEKDQLVKGVLSLAVLSVLEKRELYGVELLTVLENTPFRTQAGTLYPLLNKLHKHGFIKHRWQTSDFGPARKYYQLSSNGKKHLKLLRTYWEDMTQVIKEQK